MAQVCHRWGIAYNIFFLWNTTTTFSLYITTRSIIKDIHSFIHRSPRSWGKLTQVLFYSFNSFIPLYTSFINSSDYPHSLRQVNTGAYSFIHFGNSIYLCLYLFNLFIPLRISIHWGESTQVPTHSIIQNWGKSTQVPIHSFNWGKST